VGYHRPDRVEDAFQALAQGASVIAGGTDWYPARGDGPVPQNLLDITRLPQFSGINRYDGGWRIGAATSWSAIVNADLPPAFAGLQAAGREVGSVQIQNAGTIGGNLCNASPAADGMPALLTLDANVQLVSVQGTRRLPLAQFVTGVRQTALHKGELLQAIDIPDTWQAPGTGAAFAKLGARKYLVISIAMVASILRLQAGRVADARVAVGACSAVAQRLGGLEKALQGAAPQDFAARVAQAPLTGLAPIADVRGSAEYRLDAVRELVSRALITAAEAADER